MQKLQPKFTEEQKRELIEVHPWIQQGGLPKTVANSVSLKELVRFVCITTLKLLAACVSFPFLLLQKLGQLCWETVYFRLPCSGFRLDLIYHGSFFQWESWCSGEYSVRDVLAIFSFLVSSCNFVWNKTSGFTDFKKEKPHTTWKTNFYFV